MAIDAYVKFGESNDRSPVYNTPLPAIEGDSDDSDHHWWCELRDCGFDLENPNQGGDSQGSTTDDKKKPKSGYKPVVLKKRVDWGSYLLFRKCCEAAPAEDTADDAEEKKDKPGLIDLVTVHICRPDGQGNKIPFIVVAYQNVRVIHFKVGMSGPESSEDITFEFDAVSFEYVQTDPYTGEPMKGSNKTGFLPNHSMDPAPAPGGSGGSGGSSGDSGGAASPALPAGASSTLAAHIGDGGASGGSTSISPVSTAVDDALASGYPGLWGENGFGVLPD